MAAEATLIKTPKKRRLNYSRDDMEKALHAVENKLMSKRQASKNFNVPKSTLLDKLNGKTPRNRTIGHRPFLTEQEELELVQWIKDGYKQGAPPRKEEILNTAQKMVLAVPGRVTPFKDGRPGWYWWKMFLRRHPEVSLCFPDTTTKANSTVSDEAIRFWFGELYRYINDMGMIEIFKDAGRVYYADEANIQICPETDYVIDVKSCQTCYENTNTTNKVILTFMGTFNARGDIITPTILFPYVKMPHSVLETIPDGINYLTSSNGWLTPEIFIEFIDKKFNPWLEKKNIKKPVILFLDGHKTHLTLQVSVLCDKLNIILYLLPPNMTHLIQSTDIGLFKPLKTFWTTEINKQQKENSNILIKRREVPTLLKNAVTQICRQTICNSFSKTGLYPLNVDAIDFNKMDGQSENENDETSSTKSFSIEQYETTLEILENHLGTDYIKRNTPTRTTMSLDLYNFYTSLKENIDRLDKDRDSRPSTSAGSSRSDFSKVEPKVENIEVEVDIPSMLPSNNDPKTIDQDTSNSSEYHNAAMSLLNASRNFSHMSSSMSFIPQAPTSLEQALLNPSAIMPFSQHSSTAILSPSQE